MLALTGKHVVVIGLGASGVAAARLCALRGARVTAADEKPRGALSPQAQALEAEGIVLATGSNEAAPLAGCDLVVVSPGVPSFPALDAAEGAGTPVWGEIELAFQCRAHASPLVAVGGTNGKSTTTSLIGALLEKAGKKVFTGGNLGEPWASHVDEAFDAVVLEVSSFQMERLAAFRPEVGVLLNVTDDHLDRYAGFDDYARAKGNCFERQTAADVAVVPFGDAVCEKQARRGAGRLRTFGPGGDFDVTDVAIIDHARGLSYSREAIGLSGGHNALNVAASLAAVAPFELSPEVVRQTLREFQPLPHRTVRVADLGGVRYYDDSKGTNVGASVTAVLGLVEPKVVLIAGGRDKGGSYGPLAEAMRDKGRAVVVIGEAAERIADALSPVVPVARADSMDSAVRRASELARQGDAVLLSPACSSFDMFRDYKHRGDEFVRAVKALLETKGGAS
ncbi:MAG TPA: UDP-N-acetylmuramoyl-L-alanine--D-glutamate ligase [Polyangiaceae bacterium]|nr:UDP-N-acetylmuramoyl-L-alanine--D-glutamate ligase [Polyangiaceae bacterium]